MSDNSLNSDSRPDSLDLVLDHAFASYTPLHPRPGLEARVRARLADAADSTHGRARTAIQVIWATTAVFAVAALLLIVIQSHIRPAPANLAAIQARPPISAVRIQDRSQTATPLQPSRKVEINPAWKPRLAPRVPQRRPTQQQLIAQLIANGPEAIASLARDDGQLDKPISTEPLPDDRLVIEPIEITPIEDNPAEAGGTF
jgi:hypothetical protein